MPLYEFCCQTCGPFDQWRSLNEASLPLFCSSCQAIAKRIYSAPGLIMTPYALRRRVEQSAEPKVVKRPQSEEPVPHQHSAHQHSHAHHSRPWMVGH